MCGAVCGVGVPGLHDDFDVSTDPVVCTIYSMNLEMAKGPNLQRLVSSFLALIAMNLTFSGFVITTLLLLLSFGPLSGGGPVSGSRLAAIMPSYTFKLFAILTRYIYKVIWTRIFIKILKKFEKMTFCEAFHQFSLLSLGNSGRDVCT